ncbi:hypothetical protein I862_01400 [endosymbiont of Acanthamoeba sp. UWC8]|uniref:hypothetical protein n=1 Tax=endosymbiont of Acanthamoeba sp. UWC8 TaxID=86106 RepID=UPI0004D0DBD4|nr:hypothetical protein [endosymbiont of Acanthamoeba sp. UWC8]AIF80843.1 hypothetical protein I862_01400 [endosymbiont of Acanthamoeba sp. UWC8]
MKEYPLARVTSILYQPYEVIKGTKSWICSTYNYCSYVISSSVNKMDERPIYYNALFLGFFSLSFLSLPATAGIIGAMGVSYGATTLANHIVNLYGDEGKFYAQMITTIGEAVMSMVCMTIISAAVMSLFAASPLAAIPVAILIIPAAIISAAVFTQIRRLEYAIENSTIGKDELERNLGRKFISNAQDLFQSIINAAVRSTLSSVFLNVLELPVRVGTLLTVSISLIFSEFMSKSDYINFQDVVKSSLKGATKTAEVDINSTLGTNLHVDSLIEKIAVGTLLSAVFRPIDVLLGKTFQKFANIDSPKIEISEKAKSEIKQVYENKEYIKDNLPKGKAPESYKESAQMIQPSIK